MVVLLGPKNAYIKRLPNMCKMRREVKELDIVLYYLKLEGLIMVRLMTIK